MQWLILSDFLVVPTTGNCGENAENFKNVVATDPRMWTNSP